MDPVTCDGQHSLLVSAYYYYRLGQVKMAVRVEWCTAALLVLLLSFLVLVAVRYADSPADPEVDYDAVSA